jgi:hypothetical protein
LNRLLACVTYRSVDLSDRDAVARALSPFADKPCVSYLAIPPDLFVPTCSGLQAAGVLAPPSRLVLEKPIGHDLASARAINEALRGFLDESRIFRIDHYLGKAPVQNLLALRFGNTLMEAVWHHRWIASVDILVAETAGVDGREGYYAKYGALRDMVQNHMLQLLALIAMEPPGSLDAGSLREEKRKVLKALRPMRPADVLVDTVRGRYGAGVVDGRAVRGFEHESQVETFVALRAHIDNWRWAGVPFRLVTGKRMTQRSTEVLVSFKPVSHWLFERPPAGGATPNRLRMRLQPDENIELGLMGSLAAPEWGGTELQTMSLDLSMPAYARPPDRLRAPAARCAARQPGAVRHRRGSRGGVVVDRQHQRRLARSGGTRARLPGGQLGPGGSGGVPAGDRARRRIAGAAHMSAQLALLADIGGTNARFALADLDGAHPLHADSVRTFEVAHFESLAAAAQRYLDDVAADRSAIATGVFALAGRVDGDAARITNHTWTISRRETQARWA